MTPSTPEGDGHIKVTAFWNFARCCSRRRRYETTKAALTLYRVVKNYGST